MGYASENEGRHVFYRVTPGLDVSLGGDFAGVYAGWSEFATYEASEAPVAAPQTSTASHYVRPMGWTWIASDGTQRWLGWTMFKRPAPSVTPRFVQHFYIGAEIGFSSSFAGVQLGTGRITGLIATPVESGVYVLNYASRAPAAGWLMRISKEPEL